MDIDVIRGAIESHMPSGRLFFMYSISGRAQEYFWSVLAGLPLKNSDVNHTVHFVIKVENTVSEVVRIMKSYLREAYTDEKYKSIAKGVVINIVNAILDRDKTTLKKSVKNTNTIAAMIFTKITGLDLPKTKKDINSVLDKLCSEDFQNWQYKPE